MHRTPSNEQFKRHTVCPGVPGQPKIRRLVIYPEPCCTQVTPRAPGQSPSPHNPIILIILTRSIISVDPGARCLDAWSSYEVSINDRARPSFVDLRRGNFDYTTTQTYTLQGRTLSGKDHIFDYRLRFTWLDAAVDVFRSLQLISAVDVSYVMMLFTWTDFAVGKIA